MVEGMCLLVVLIGRLGRRGMWLVGMRTRFLERPGMSLAHPRCSASPRLLRTCWREMDLHVPWSMSKKLRCPSASLEAARSMATWNALESPAYAPATRPRTFPEF